MSLDGQSLAIDNKNVSIEDKIKSEIYSLIDNINPRLYKDDCYHFFNLASICYESIKYDNIKNLKSIVKKIVPLNNLKKQNLIKSYSQEEFITKGLFSYSEDYNSLSLKQKKKKDREALRFIKKFSRTKDISIILKYYRIYDQMKNNNILNFSCEIAPC